MGLTQVGKRMKKLITFGLLGFVVLGAWTTGAAIAPTNFSGTWVLDKSKSEAVPQQLANVDVTWVITQDDKQLKREQQLGANTGQSATFNLDGSERTADLTGRISGKARLKAKWLDGGKALELSAVVDGVFNKTAMTFTTTEQWELSEGGKTLTVHHTREGPRGKQEATFIFTKK